jgi:hypothetical protein
MSKFLSFIMTMALSISLLNAQNDTICGWNFPSNTADNTDAEFGLSGNLGYDLRAENSAGDVRPITFVDGQTAGDYAASATNWDNGADDKFWSIKFKASGYIDFKLSFKMRTESSNPGPADWKIQARPSGGSWEDAISGGYTIDTDWATGTISELDLPDNIDDQGTSSLYVRWIMTSNMNINGVNADSNGIVAIDNIVITATNTATGLNEIVYANITKVYPNPCTDFISIHAANVIERIEVTNNIGEIIYTEQDISGTSYILNTEAVTKGIYFVRIFCHEMKDSFIEKIIIQ